MTAGVVEKGRNYPGSNWWRKKTWSGADGRHSNNSYDCTIEEYRDPASITYIDSDNKLVTSGHWDFPYTKSLLAIPSITDVELLLASKLLGKVGAFDFNPVQFAIEGRENVSMLRGVPKQLKMTALSIFKAGVLVKKGRFKRAFSTLRLANAKRKLTTHHFRFDPMLYRRVAKIRKANGDWVSSAWLELRHGWQPLLLDFHNGLKFFESEISRQNATQQRFVCREKAQTNATRYVTGSWKYWLSRLSIRKEQLIAYVRREPDLQEALALSVADPAVLAWEFLPASFVADWFISVGDWLSARCALRKLKATYVRTTTCHQFVSNLVLDVAKCSLGALAIKKITNGGDNYYFEKTTVKRRASTSFNIPFPSWHLPFKSELLHLADSLAIFHQLRLAR